MKILELLNEDTDLVTSKRAKEIFDAMTTPQIVMLVKLTRDDFDPLDASDKQHALLDQLMNMGMLDSAYGLTELGKKIVGISQKLHGKDVMDAAKTGWANRARVDSHLRKGDSLDVDIEDSGDADMGDDDEEIGIEDTAANKKKVRASGEPRRLNPRRELDSFDGEDARHMNDDGEYEFD